LKTGDLKEDVSCPLVNESGVNILWKAKWIAPPDSKTENYYFLARKNFEVNAIMPGKAVLRIAADSRYVVYINGHFVGNGPVRGTHKHYFCDTYDVSAVLATGINWIAVEIHCPVTASFTMAPHAPGLLAEIEGLAATGLSWQVKRDPSHRSDAMIYTKQIGFSEWKNMALENVGWLTGKDNAETWQVASVVGIPDNFGGRTVVPRSIAGLTANHLYPVKIVAHGSVPNTGEGVSSADYAMLMQSEMHFHPPQIILENPETLIRRNGCATVLPNPKENGAYIIMDFGREVFGNLIVDVEGPAATIMDVGHDEGMDDGRLMIMRASYRFADRFELREGRQIIAQRLHNRGFRYIQLVFRNFKKPIRVHSIRIVNRVYSRETQAAFSCSDPFLVKLWEASVNTVRMCSSDTFMDCIWREQAFWLNDQAVTNLFYLGLTGDHVFAAHNLRIGRDGAMPDGLIPFVYPSDRKTLSSSTPALWTMTLSDYYLYTGDLELLKELQGTMEKALALYDAWRDTDGLIPDQPGMWNFTDWGYCTAGVNIKGKTAVMNMLIAAAYKQAAFIEAALGDKARTNEYIQKSRQALAALNALLWDASRGCYLDCTEPTGPCTSSQHPLALGLSYCLLEEPQRSKAIANLMNADLIRPELCFQHYVIDSLAKHARIIDALGVIKQYWSKMVESGADTVWECAEGRTAFNNNGSLCHAFACTPLYFMQTVILGVKPIQPGFKEFAVIPRSAGLAKAEGEIPTPHGNISIRWSKQTNGQIALQLEVPKGTSGRTKEGKLLGAGSHNLVIIEH